VTFINLRCVFDYFTIHRRSRFYNCEGIRYTVIIVSTGYAKMPVFRK